MKKKKKKECTVVLNTHKQKFITCPQINSLKEAMIPAVLEHHAVVTFRIIYFVFRAALFTLHMFFSNTEK